MRVCLYCDKVCVVYVWNVCKRGGELRTYAGECPYNNTFSLYFLDQLAANMMVGPSARQVSSNSMQLKGEIFLMTKRCMVNRLDP
jgi:hypothetical protein